jgi:hypothetical protein
MKSRPATLALIALLAAMSLIWIRGELQHDAIVLNLGGHMLIVGSFPHHIDITAFRDDTYHGKWFRLLFNEPFVHPMGIFWQLRASADPTMLELDIPWWLPSLFLIAILARTSIVHSRAARRRSHNQCPTCGYDLRATPMRCPECGLIQPLDGTQKLDQPAT